MNVYKVNQAKTVLVKQVKNLYPKSRKIEPKVYYFKMANPNGKDPNGSKIFSKFGNSDFVKKVVEKYKNIRNFIK